MDLFKHAEQEAASILKPASFKLAEMSIHDRIQQAISQSGQSKSAIAKACGVSPSAVTQWINGDTKAPTAERLLKLARVTRVSYAWLIEGKGSMRDVLPSSVAEITPPYRQSEAESAYRSGSHSFAGQRAISRFG